MIPIPEPDSPPLRRSLLVGWLPDPQGADALALADVLAGLLDARPTILRVVQVAPYLLGDEPEAALERETREELLGARERLAARDPLTRAVGEPSAARGLFAEAAREEPVAIVVGSSHRGGFGRVLADSTATTLLQGAPAAVAVAPLGYAEREGQAVERIGVAFDDSPESRLALATAVELAVAAGAELTLFTGEVQSPFGYGPAIEALTAGEVEDAATERAQAILATGIGLVPAELTVSAHRVRAEVGAALERESERLDLLVVGSRGYGPLRRTLLGSVSTHLVHHAHCPVVVVPRGAEPEGPDQPS